MANEVMTILDYAATQKDPVMKGMVNSMMDDNSPGGGMGLLGQLPVIPVDSLSMVINRITNEGAINPIFRPIGGTYNVGTVAITQESVNVANLGQDVLMDLAFLKKKSNYLQGMEPEAMQLQYLGKRINRVANLNLYSGNKAVTPDGLNGLRQLCDPRQVINVNADVPNGASAYTNGLNVWSAFTPQAGRDFITGLDYMVDLIGGDGAGIILCNNQFQRAIGLSLRDSGNSESLYSADTDKWGRYLQTYRGCKLVNPGANTAVQVLKDAINNTNALIPNNFSYGSSNITTEAYAVKIDPEEGVALLEFSPLDIRTVADETTQGPAKLIRADWYFGFYRFKESAIAKMAGVIVV